jgi:hypothetical protein
MAVSDDLDIAEIERRARIYAMAGFGPVSWELQRYWPGHPCRGFIIEMLRRDFGLAGVEYARTLPIFTRH